jgi:hypothetical protein
MKRLLLLLGLVIPCPGNVVARDTDATTLHELLESAKLPEGYQSTTQDVKDGDKIVGKMIVVSKPNEVSKVVVYIDFTDRSTVPARRAAVKGYVNGFVSGLAKGGFKVIEQKLPDLAKESFDKPIFADLVVANGNGKKLWDRQIMFFTDKGFMVQVIGDSSDNLATLADWAKTIKPKTRR